MDTPFLITRKILIDAEPAVVWDALTNPKKTKQFMFNCEVKSRWKVGATIRWRGNYQGYDSRERGIILQIERLKLLKYTSFDPNFGLEDHPENYLIITYQLNEKDGKTQLSTIIQNQNNDKNRMKHVAAGWDSIVLPSLLKLLRT